MKLNPGLIGWAGIAAVVALADGIAITRNHPTMSDEFHDHFGVAIILASGVFAHLIFHRRVPA